ncbi:VOC family protein [Moheibacter sediminis]|uniref:Catechol-2,3-dioxygenase n=1 Tax=Moheibacter sediminis TaxID=1434700 RepID=A0A1W2AYZ0_9FLAO|nr:glyoxalase [Moheibacter sediminis]SMC65750.1 hypothetical protein SAMN06296427_105142 [Moheibacter sediminis]
MKIKELTLLTHKLLQEKIFYTKTLGFELVNEDLNSFSVKVGWSILTFQESNDQHNYHYCFLIPSNNLNEALHWVEKKWNIIEMEDSQKTVHFDTWNADSFYFHDASGNIAEFIVRYDMNNPGDAEFDVESILCVNEIGLPTTDIQQLSFVLEDNLGIKFWKGDMNRFGTVGSQEGLFLLPNYNLKKTWFPTELNIQPDPLNITIEINENTIELQYLNGEIEILSDKLIKN